MHYHMPPTDPRFLDITDEEIAYDLLVLRMHRRLQVLAEVPSEAEADNPHAREDYEQRLDAVKHDLANDSVLRTLLAKSNETRHDAMTERPGAVPSIRLRRGPT